MSKQRIDHKPTLPLSYKCQHCGTVSRNPHDIEKKYCGYCHRFSYEEVFA